MCKCVNQKLKNSKIFMMHLDAMFTGVKNEIGNTQYIIHIEVTMGNK